MRALALLVIYPVALLLIWQGLQIAPDMKWPSNPNEWLATEIVSVGLVLKFIGHFVLLFGKAR